jgi:hypothetical protein
VLVLALGCGGGQPANPGLGLGAGAAAGSGGTTAAVGGGAGLGNGGMVASGAGGQGAMAGSPMVEVPSSGGSGVSGDTGDGDVCATVTATATLEPVFLAFAFDVSGSMGKGDHPWHDATLKWDPVVAATRGVFEDTL